MLRIIRFSVLVVCFASMLFAQGGYAVISGRVQDTSNAVIPGVAIAAQNVSTDVIFKTVSNGVGYYIFTNLIPGTYTVTVQHPGFKNLEQPEDWCCKLAITWMLTSFWNWVNRHSG